MYQTLRESRLCVPSRFRSIFLLFVTIFLAGQAAHAQTPAGSITAVTGSVQLIRSGRTITAAVGTPVQVGDELKTAAGSNVTVTLSYQSRFELGESAQMTLDEHTVGATGATTHLGLALGALRNWVTKVASGSAANYEVHTPNAVGAARGTMYDVQYEENVTRKGFVGCTKFTDVAVYEGTVDVSNPTAPGNQHVLVKKGQKTTVPCALVPIPPGSAGAAGLLGDTAIVGAFAGTVTAAGIVGGLAGAGAFSGSGSSGPVSGSQ
jgi:hypothetical protein